MPFLIFEFFVPRFAFAQTKKFFAFLVVGALVTGVVHVILTLKVLAR